MKEIFETALAVLGSLGGGVAIVLGTSTWLGKVWANRILENEKKEHQLEIESYKSQLSMSLSKINSMNERTLYISKVQYDKEFEIYQDIWEKMHDCIVGTLNLYPSYGSILINDSKEELLAKEKYKDYLEKYNLYSRAIERYAPFYRDDFYPILDSIRSNSSRMGNIFDTYNYRIKYNISYSKNKQMTDDEEYQVYTKIPNELEENRKELKTKIYEYLRNLQVYQN